MEIEVEVTQTDLLLVQDKSGEIIELDAIDSNTAISTLKQRIKETRSEGDFYFKGPIGQASGDELVKSYISINKNPRVLMLKPWRSTYGTFLEHQLRKRFPSTSSTKMAFIQVVTAVLLSGLIAASTQVSFHLKYNPDVPYTLQTLGVFLCCFFVGIYSTISVGVYLIIGASGAKIFADHTSGIQYLTSSPSCGFLWGFLFAALVVGGLNSWRGWDRNFYTSFVATTLGWICIFVPGITVLSWKLGWNWGLAVQYGLIPFIPAEAIKFAIITIIIPLSWFICARFTNYGKSVSFWTDMNSFFNMRFVSF